MSAPRTGTGSAAPVVAWVPTVPGLNLGTPPRHLGERGVPRPAQRAAEPATHPPAAPAETEPDPVFLWLLPQPAVAAFAARLGGTETLSGPERGRLARMRAGSGERFLGGRLLARYALSQVIGGAPSRWLFTTGTYGKPEVVSPEPAVRFNISHTPGMVACAVSPRRACGVDVEGARVRPDALAAITRHLAPAEQTALAGLRPDVRGREAAEYWVLKEAYLKGLGVGLHRGLDSFAFTPPHREPVQVYDPWLRADWQFRLIRPAHPEPAHVAAVAVEGSAPVSLHVTRLTGRAPDPAVVTGRKVPAATAGASRPAPTAAPLPLCH